MLKRHFPILALSMALTAGYWAAAAGETYTDPATAPIDYQIQGEFEGKAGDARLGIQVIALGNGSYQAVFLPGGLPGKGWDKRTRVRVDGKAQGSEVQFGQTGSGWIGVLEENAFRGQTASGQKFRAKRVRRKSPTLGKKAPSGALALFDGKSADAWQNGRMTEDGLLKIGVKSKKEFKDFTLHMEFRTPFQPNDRGQARGNSGLFLQDRYELQILDSFGLDGKNNECGGFYQQREPDENMCLPPLVWQTYDIDFKSARFDDAGKKLEPAVVTVRHNGVVIHDKFALPGPGPVGRKEDNTGGVFQIQDHGNPVVVRNFWVLER